MNRLCLATVSLLAAFVGSGCGNACKTVDSTPVAYDGGHHYGSLYMTSDFAEPWLDFQGGREYLLMHHLHTTHLTMTPWVAFTQEPLPTNGVGNISLSPGNQTLVQAVDPEFVRVRNDTCEHFYLLMQIEAHGDEDAGAAGAAGASN